MMLTDLTIKDFMIKIAGDSSLPVGKCTAEMNAALAASLTQRSVTLLASVQENAVDKEQSEGMIENLALLSEEFMMCMDRELDAHQELQSARQLTELTPDEMKFKEEQVQKFVLISAMIPFDVAEMAMRMMDFILEVFSLMNKKEQVNLVSAISLARCAVQNALYAVKENINELKSKQVVDDLMKKAKEIEAEAIRKEELLKSIS